LITSGKVKASGRIPTVEEIKKIFEIKYIDEYKNKLLSSIGQFVFLFR